MKTIIFLLAFILLSSFAPDQAEPFQLTWPLILAILGACYEAISRLVPTRKVWSIIGKFLEVLTWFSSLLDRKKR